MLETPPIIEEIETPISATESTEQEIIGNIDNVSNRIYNDLSRLGAKIEDQRGNDTYTIILEENDGTTTQVTITSFQDGYDYTYEINMHNFIGEGAGGKGEFTLSIFNDGTGDFIDNGSKNINFNKEEVLEFLGRVRGNIEDYQENIEKEENEREREEARRSLDKIDF